MTPRWLSVVLLLATTVALSSGLSFQEHAVVQESLSRVHPRMRASWLKERGLDDSYYTTFRKPDSQGLVEVGRWSYGPSYDVDGRVTPTETLVALARGSGVSLLRFSRQDSLSIRLLSDINAEGLMCRVNLADTLLYVGSRAGLEVYNIADEQTPVRLSWIQTALNDFDVQDSLAFVIGADDSFKVYNVSDPANPVFRGACRDSGYCVSVSDTLALVAERWGLHVLGVGNPASPHRLNSWGSAIDAVTARANLAYVTTFNPNQPGEIALTILDVSAPQNIVQIGHLNGPGGPEVYVIDTLAFCSGDAVSDTMKIVSVANSAQPRLIGTGRTRGWDEGIWASGSNQAAFVADNYEGLYVFDIESPANPVLDTVLPGVDLSYDVYIDNGRAYIATDKSGLKILDVSDPTRPFTLGSYDTAGQAPLMRSAAAKDSFAFAGWGRPALLTLSVSDPTRPVVVGGCDSVTNPPKDMVLRDSFVYVAEQSFFQVVNVARPREPVLVGSCVLPYDSYDMDLQDTFAYVANLLSLQIVNVARPDSPRVIGTWSGNVDGVDAADTIAYVTGNNYSVYALNIANPSSPYVLDSAYFGQIGTDVVVAGSFAYVSEDVVHIVDVADPRNLRLVGTASVPYWTRRLYYSAPYLYACCAEGGVCILETIPTGVAESKPARLKGRQLALSPSVTAGWLTVSAMAVAGSSELTVYDVTGKEVLRLSAPAQRNGLTERWPVDLSRLSAGVYVLRLDGSGVSQTGKVVLTRR